MHNEYLCVIVFFRVNLMNQWLIPTGYALQADMQTGTKTVAPRRNPKDEEEEKRVSRSERRERGRKLRHPAFH